MPRTSFAVAILLFAGLCASAPRGIAAPLIPPQQDEELQNLKREEWIRQIHRAAPGTDWRALEAANREQTRLALGGVGILSAPWWTEVGADGNTGRTLCVAPSSVHSSLLYLGTALGGMWSGSVNGGGSWTPLTDALGLQVQQLVVVPRVTRDDFVIADGHERIVYTSNGGASWGTSAGLPAYPLAARRLVQDAASPLRIFALLDGWYWTGSSWEVDTYLLRSTDGGATFAALRNDRASQGVDLWMDRLAGGTLWLLTGNTLLRSTSHGDSFAAVSTLPLASPAGASLAGSEAGAPKLFAALNDGAAWHLYASADAGATWRTRAAPADCWGVLEAPIRDSSQVFLGGVNLYRSTDGGATFGAINDWSDYYGDPAHKLHADMHGIQSVLLPAGGPAAAERIYVSTDGGTYLLDLAGSTPQNLTLSGLRNLQYYGVRTSGANRVRISAGSQDQGFQTTVSAPSFVQQISGDYGHLTGALSANNMVWSVYPGFLLLQLTENPVALELPATGTNFPSDANIPWMPAILAHPDDSSSVLFGARHLWRIRRTAPLSYAYTSLADFDAGDGDAVGAIAIAPGNHQRWYVATYKGRLYYSTNGGASFNLSGSPGPASHYFYGSDLLVSPTNPLVAYVCGSGYTNAAVYRTTDGGVTWAPYGTGMPSTLAHALAFDNATNQVVYAATEAGPFRCVGGAWENMLTGEPGAPLTDYWDVESLPDLGVVRFATYGRGLWDFHVHGPAAADAPAPRPSARLDVGPNPSHGAVRLAWSLPEGGRVRIDVFDVLGRRLATPVDRAAPAGTGEARFDGRDAAGRPLAAGIYLVRLEAPGGRAVRQMVVTR